MPHLEILRQKALREAMPLDFSFKKIEFLDKTQDDKPRKDRLGKTPYRGKDKKFLTKSIWLNNNNIKSIINIGRFISTNIEYPDILSWIDLSYNKITEIDPDIMIFQNLIILYFHGNLIDNFETIIKLRALPKLKRITLHGNPISEICNYRRTIIYLVPQLFNLDFSPIVKRERFSPVPPGVTKRYEHLIQ